MNTSTCHATGCDAPATLSWQRIATPEELAERPGLPDAETPATVLVLACDAHKISRAGAAGLHAMTCQAPPTCTCSPTYPPTTPPPGS